jgi:hypothetical protein
MTDPEARSVMVALVLALVACVVMLVLPQVRVVGAEDDCAMGVWEAQPSPFGMLCVWEPPTE